MSVTICQTDWANDLLIQLQPLWKDAILCDTTIECSQKNIIQAHSILLAASSPKLFSYFRTAEVGSYTIVTPDVPVFVWRNVLTFIYQGRLDLREEELVATYNFARKIEMLNFSKKLGEELKRCKLTKEDQQAFLRACVSPESQVTSVRNHPAGSPQSVAVSQPSLAPLIREQFARSPQGRVTSPQAQVTSQQSHESSLGEQRRPQATSPQVPTTRTDVRSEMQKQSSREATPVMPHPKQESPKTAAVDKVIMSERYECPECLQSFNRSLALQKHISECVRLHKQKPTGIVSYKKFYSRTPTEGVKGKEASKFKCDLCGKEYAAYQGLYMHLKSKHGDKVQAVAASSNSRHFRPGQLVNKPAKSELLNKTASCPVCNKQFHNYAAMLSHKTTHTKSMSTRRSGNSTAAVPGEGEVEEEDSARKSVTSPEVGGNGNSDESHSCPICGRDFKHKMHLGSHMRSHDKNA